MAEYEYKTIQTGEKIEKMIVFLHGYNSCIADLEPYAEMLCQRIKHLAVVIPTPEMVCERNPNKKQWYGLVDVDPERKRRKPETPTTEIVEIYNKTGDRISDVARKLNSFISTMQKEYKVNNKHTYVMGFSQGAMLAIYIGLTRRYELGGVFPFAGIVCGEEKLASEINSRPEVYLFHGTNDLGVQYKTLSYTKSWLDKHDVAWKAIEYDGIEHRLIEDEMADAADIINSVQA